MTPTAPLTAAPVSPARLPRLLLGGPDPARLMPLAEHLDRQGGFLLRGFEGGHGPTLLIDTVERAGLTGHSEAGFPTARKIRAVAGRRGQVVVNASEGEPASRKDTLPMRARPHLVLDDTVIAADAVGAHEVIVALHAEPSSVQAAINGRQAAGFDTVAIKVVQVPKDHVANEESAVVRFLSDAPALPTFTPPRPFEREGQLPSHARSEREDPRAPGSDRPPW